MFFRSKVEHFAASTDFIISLDMQSKLAVFRSDALFQICQNVRIT